MGVTWNNVFRMECKKAFHNRYFWIALAAGGLFAAMSGLYMVESYQESARILARMGGNPMRQAFGLYNSWIGGEGNSLGFTLFFALLPFLAALPYGWSYQAEIKSGYAKQVQLRAGRHGYLLAKGAAAFLSGGTVILLPLVINFIAVACFVPAVCPTIQFIIYYPMHYGAIASELYFTHPFLFVLMYLCIDFVFAGLFALVATAAGCLSGKRVAAVLTPFLLVMLLQYLRTFLYGRYYKEISPMYFLHASSIQNVADPWIMLAEGLILLLVSGGILYWKGIRRETF